MRQKIFYHIVLCKKNNQNIPFFFYYLFNLKYNVYNYIVNCTRYLVGIIPKNELLSNIILLPTYRHLSQSIN